MKDKKLVYGVGINDADYVVRSGKQLRYVNGKQKQKLVWVCPLTTEFGRVCCVAYSSKFQEESPNLHKGCSVSEEWLRFSNFKSWMESQDLGRDAVG